MKCIACQGENQLRADYCAHCGRPISEKLRREAYDETIYGKIDRVLEAKSWLTLEKITKHPVVRILILAVLAVLVVVNVTRNGTSLGLRNGDGYRLGYDKDADKYLVTSALDTVRLSVNIPRKTEASALEVYQDGELLETVVIEEDGGVEVQNGGGRYYVIRAAYEDGKEDSLLFFVVPEEAEK